MWNSFNALNSKQVAGLALLLAEQKAFLIRLHTGSEQGMTEGGWKAAICGYQEETVEIYYLIQDDWLHWPVG